MELKIGTRFYFKKTPDIIHSIKSIDNKNIQIYKNNGYFTYTYIQRAAIVLPPLKEGDILTLKFDWKNQGKQHGWIGCGSIEDIDTTYIPKRVRNNVTIATIQINKKDVVIRSPLLPKTFIVYKDLFNETGY